MSPTWKELLQHRTKSRQTLAKRLRDESSAKKQKHVENKSNYTLQYCSKTNMCDDYETESESELEYFDSLDFIDDTQKLNFVLASDRDDSSDEDEFEEVQNNDDSTETVSSNFSHFKSSNLNNLGNANTGVLNLPNEPSSPVSSKQDTVSYTELVPRKTLLTQQNSETTTVTDFYDNQEAGPSSYPGSNLINQQFGQGSFLQSIGETHLETYPSSQWTVEHELYNFASVQERNLSNRDGNLEQEISNEIQKYSLLNRNMLQQCLARNRDYQNQIMRELRILETSIRDNKKKQFDLVKIQSMDEEDEDSAITPLPTLARFSYPYFKDSKDCGPPDNEDAKENRKRIVIDVYERRPTWNKKDKELLAEGVQMQNLKMKLAPLLMRLKDLESKRVVDLDEVEKLKQQINLIKEMPPKELEENLEGLDWDKLSTECLPKHDAINCQLQWSHFGHPRVNLKPWTKQEDKMLLDIAKGKEHVEWNLVAQTLQTNRTPIQCFSRYQRSLNKEFVRSKWTPEEDMQLIELVKTFGEGNWQKVADYTEGHVAEQCMHRYMKACKPKRKGKWTEEENEILLKAVEIVGKCNWKKVAEYVPGRTGTQVRERYVNVIDPSLNRGAWTPEEDQKLLELIDKYGEGNWSKIAKDIGHRTDNQCWRRWLTVKKKESTNYRINTLRKKRELVVNFVSRRSEKPTITHEDLDIEDLPIPAKPKSSTKKAKNKNVKAENVDTNTESLKPSEDQDKTASKKSKANRRRKENLPSNCNDDTSTTLTEDATTKSGKVHENKARTLKPNLSENKVSDCIADKGPLDPLNEGLETNELGIHSSAEDLEIISISSEEEWHDESLKIDLTSLGTRASTRKKTPRTGSTEKVNDVMTAEIELNKDKNKEQKQEIAKNKEQKQEISSEPKPKTMAAENSTSKPKVKRGPKGKRKLSMTSKQQNTTSKNATPGNFKFLEIPAFPSWHKPKRKKKLPQSQRISTVTMSPNVNTDRTSNTQSVDNITGMVSPTTADIPAQKAVPTPASGVPKNIQQIDQPQRIFSQKTVSSTVSTPIVRAVTTQKTSKPQIAVIQKVTPTTPITTAQKAIPTSPTTDVPRNIQQIGLLQGLIAPKAVSVTATTPGVKVVNTQQTSKQQIADIGRVTPTTPNTPSQKAVPISPSCGVPRNIQQIGQPQKYLKQGAVPATVSTSVRAVTTQQTSNQPIADIARKTFPPSWSIQSSSNVDSPSRLISKQQKHPVHSLTPQQRPSRGSALVAQRKDVPGLSNPDNVAPFSLLLQAFNVNVAAVLQKLNPGGNAFSPPEGSNTVSFNANAVQASMASTSVSQNVIETPISTSSSAIPRTEPLTAPAASSVSEEITERLNSSADAFLTAKEAKQSKQKLSSPLPCKVTEPTKTPLAMSASQTDTPTLTTTASLTKNDSNPSIMEPVTLSVVTSASHTNMEPAAQVSCTSSQKIPKASQSASSTLLSIKATELPIEKTSTSLPTDATTEAILMSQKNMEQISTLVTTLTPTKNTITTVPAASASSTSPILIQDTTNSKVLLSESPTTQDVSPEYRSPSRRKATTPRKWRCSPAAHWDSFTSKQPITDISVANELESTKVSSIPETRDNNNALNKEMLSTGSLVTQKKNNRILEVPLIPPLPPSVTTMKGFRNLLAMKEQLQKLAMKTAPQTVTRNSPAKNNLTLSNEGLSKSVPTYASSGHTETQVFTSTQTQETNTHPTVGRIDNSPNMARSKSQDDGDLAPKKGKEVSTKNSENQFVTTSQVPTRMVSTENQDIENRQGLSGVIEGNDISQMLNHPLQPQRLNVEPFVKFSLYRKTREYKLLSARIQGLFLWPLLMSKVPLTGRLPEKLRKGTCQTQTVTDTWYPTKESNFATFTLEQSKIRKRKSVGQVSSRKSSSTDNVKRRKQGNNNRTTNAPLNCDATDKQQISVPGNNSDTNCDQNILQRIGSRKRPYQTCTPDTSTQAGLQKQCIKDLHAPSTSKRRMSSSSTSITKVNMNENIEPEAFPNEQNSKTSSSCRNICSNPTSLTFGVPNVELNLESEDNGVHEEVVLDANVMSKTSSCDNTCVNPQS